MPSLSQLMQIKQGKGNISSQLLHSLWRMSSHNNFQTTFEFIDQSETGWWEGGDRLVGG